MTDRIRTLTVLLERDIREDDVETVVNAIRMIKTVRDVRLGEPSDVGNVIASDNFRLNAGDLIVRLTMALSSGFGGDADSEFLEAVRVAASAHKEKRGY